MRSTSGNKSRANGNLTCYSTLAPALGGPTYRSARPCTPSYSFSCSTRPSSRATVRTHTLATLTEQQAPSLVGNRARFLVQLDCPETDVDGDHAFDCRSANPADVRSVYFCPGEVIGEDEVDVLVEGTLQIIRQRAWQGVPAFTEYRIVDAVRVTAP
jgi:hypothetical protein